MKLFSLFIKNYWDSFRLVKYITLEFIVNQTKSQSLFLFGCKSVKKFFVLLLLCFVLFLFLFCLCVCLFYSWDSISLWRSNYPQICDHLASVLHVTNPGMNRHIWLKHFHMELFGADSLLRSVFCVHEHPLKHACQCYDQSIAHDFIARFLHFKIHSWLYELNKEWA